MKKLIFFLVVLASSSQTLSAQSLSIDELIQLARCKALDCINDYIINRGYSFSKATDEADYSIYNYIDDVAQANQSNLQYLLSKRVGGYNGVTVSTTSKTYYLEIMSAIKKLGFAAVKTTNSSDRIYAYYSCSSRTKLSISTIVNAPDNQYREQTEYSISILSGEG